MVNKERTDEILKYNNYLLLQGPKGFFFYRFAKYLKNKGKKLWKINFNGGDFITFPLFKNAISFRDPFEKWEEFIEKFLKEKEIDVILLYGDYKPYHKIAIKVATKLNIDTYVFEEGYIRPHYITMEKFGINGFSALPRTSDFYYKLPDFKIPEPEPVNFRFSKRVFSCVLHYLFLELLRWRYPRYKPYKVYFPYIKFIFCQIRSVIRKILYRIKQRKYIQLFTGELSKKYFLVPLQVHNDSQIILHSPYEKIEDFITEVIESFSKNASKEHCLVFKHHPVDRGFKNYRNFINRLSEKFNIKNRVFYVHDLHLPTLIKHSLGVIIINSTVGIQSLYHNIPVKVMGNAIYDIPGLTFQGQLHKFWQEYSQIDRKLFNKFYFYVIKTTQLNGSFYGKFPFE